MSFWQIHKPNESLSLYGIQEDKNPEGQPWENWIQNWTKWLISQPQSKNPAIDRTGEYTEFANEEFEKKYGSSNVFYLAGSTGGKYERRCTIRGKKAVFVPCVCDEESTAELPSLLDANRALSIAKSNKLKDKCVEDQDNIVSLEASFDRGTKFENTLLTGKLVYYRLSTGIFDLTYEEDNLWDAVPGDCKALVDGFWLFIRPPKEAGEHTIYFHAIEDDFECEITHYLTFV